MSDYVIRRMKTGDVDQVAAIEAATFPRPWSRESFRKEAEENPAARYLVADRNGQVLGYAGAWIVLDESHITNIAVAEGERGKGVGRALTEALLQYASNLGAACATLEVRVSNQRALELYRSLGFIAAGKRKRYYEDNGEDAWLMVCEQMPPADPDFYEEETLWTAQEGEES